MTRKPRRRARTVALVVPLALSTALLTYETVVKRAMRLRRRRATASADSDAAGTLDRLHGHVARYANRVDSGVDRLKARLGGRFATDEVHIVPYRGYGTADRIFLKGRVLEDHGIAPASAEDSLWRNLVNTYRRFESDEVPGARLRVTFYGQSQEVTTDEEGYFEAWLAPAAPLPADRLWHEVELELLAPIRGASGHVTTGYVLVPPPSARFAIISDIDDTVVHTNATNLLKMGRTVFLGNARTRLPFEGVAAFYQALQAGTSGAEYNPLFYVSSSPWNLYDLLDEFLDFQEIPVGPLMLRDWGLSNEEVLPTKHAPHKRKAIRQILQSFPALPFILIGDSGQEDPEIYAEIVHEFPERILAIYIRNVSRKPARPESIVELAKQVSEAGSTLILADDTLAAASHALERSWIAPEAMPRIRAEKEADAPAPSMVEKVLDRAPRPETPTIVVEGSGAPGDSGQVSVEPAGAGATPESAEVVEQAEEIADAVEEDEGKVP